MSDQIPDVQPPAPPEVAPPAPEAAAPPPPPTPDAAVGEPAAPPPPPAPAVPEAAAPEAAAGDETPKKKKGPPRKRSEFTNWIETMYKRKEDPFTSVVLNVDRENGVASLTVTDSKGTRTSKFKFTELTGV